jgi:translation elongation factor EF-Tu-like GTPase
MNCPNCKNPLTTSTSNCEWCGSILQADQIVTYNTFLVEDSYSLLFRGTVLVGRFEKSNSITSGREFVYSKNEVLSKAIIKSIEYNREMIDSYSANETIGILI